MSIDSDNIDLVSYEKLLAKKVTLGSKVQELLNSEGFLILKAIFYNFEQDIKSKDNYDSLEAFKADRKALEIVHGLFAELDSRVIDAEQAQEDINKLIESKRSTPSLLSLDGEGTEDGQGLDS